MGEDKYIGRDGARSYAAGGRRHAQSRGTTVFPRLAVQWRVCVLAFSVGLLLVDRFEWLATVNRITGVFLVLIGLAVVGRWKQAVAREILWFGAFIVWAAVTGLTFAEDQSSVLSVLRLLGQNWALAVAVTAVSWWRSDANDVFMGLVLVAAILGGYQIAGAGVGAIGAEGGGRVSSLLDNPNGLGLACVWGIMGVAWLWPAARGSVVAQLLLAGAIPMMLMMIVLSASRKSFIVLVLFALSWYVCTQVSSTGGWARRLAVAGVLSVAADGAWTALVPESQLERRLLASRADPRLDSDRVGLYEEGFEMLRTAPVVGVGLGNFVRLSSTGQVSHSDYMEVLASTGCVGFVLYGAIYPMILLRALRLVGRMRSRVQRYHVGVAIAILVSQLVLGLGAPLFLMPFAWMIFASVLGVISRWEAEIRDERVVAQQVVSWEH